MELHPSLQPFKFLGAHQRIIRNPTVRQKIISLEAQEQDYAFSNSEKK